MADKTSVLSQMDDLMAELGIMGDQINKDQSTQQQQTDNSSLSASKKSNFLMSGPGLAAGANNNPTAFNNNNATPQQQQSTSGGAFVMSGPGLAARSINSNNGISVGVSASPTLVPNPTPMVAPIAIASETPDGRSIKPMGPPCGHCGEMIIGISTNALGKSYHPEHFVCTYCRLPFKGAFIEHDGKLYCENDYTDLFSPRCAACAKPIEDTCISALDCKFHPDCFVCSGCGTGLRGKPYKEEDGEVYCTACKVARQKRLQSKSEICAKCKLPITGEYIILGGQPLHAEHYRCEECGCEFTGKSCHEYEGRLYCYEDYQKQIRNICGACSKPIVGRSVTALGKVWHPEHFVCTTCQVPFAGSAFREHQGKAYCETHYHMYFGRLCVTCNKPVVDRGVDAFGKIYHREHFQCTGCYTLLGKEVLDWDGKPLCYKCYEALPKEVRKRIKQKKHGDKKSEVQREKLLKKEAKEKAKEKEKEAKDKAKAEKK
ncbi:LIM-type zinc finger-containing protein [Cavenderia fasciculata]|uniref:LIM-type zinc finger-containing protein n=1 Tax=Cavenderia fasciculata TaxID=261658 RepID=F4PRG9_CACFS|nr:LIM-type zinc finger-containing protein [Cavenderia fasciculata]EGG20521.1 LIM-type zinc finger-containing protein [Cavenderia fasciculata]|eukprot:XP_004358371.1 LIM-type zinc finger-containing protein [Cavenderia fasciculata]